MDPQRVVRELGFNFHSLYRIGCPAACVAVVLLNAFILDWYLIVYNGPYSYLWIIADIVVLCLFLASFYKAYPYYTQERERAQPALNCLGDLPLSYISWLVFSIVMSSKVCVIYALPNSIASQLKERNFFGPNTLQLGISLAAVVFNLLVRSYYDIELDFEQESFFQRIVGGIWIELLDTTQFLDAFSYDVNATGGYDANVTGSYGLYDIVYVTGLALNFVNYLVPTVALYHLARSSFGVRMRDFQFIICRHIFVSSYYLVVNSLMFGVRMYIWHHQRQEISVFMAKNMVVIGKCILEMLKCCFHTVNVGLRCCRCCFDAASLGSENRGEISEMQGISS